MERGWSNVTDFPFDKDNQTKQQQTNNCKTKQKSQQ